MDRRIWDNLILYAHNANHAATSCCLAALQVTHNIVRRSLAKTPAALLLLLPPACRLAFRPDAPPPPVPQAKRNVSSDHTWFHDNHCVLPADGNSVYECGAGPGPFANASYHIHTHDNHYYFPDQVWCHAHAHAHAHRANQPHERTR